MNTKTKIPYLLMLFLCLAYAHTGYAQPCSVTSVPPYKSCFTEYFTAISASGDMGTTSSISVSASSCTGTYFDLHTTQGIDAPIGANVTLNFSRFTTQYTAYVSVYIDRNNSGTYEALEYPGTPDPLALRDIELAPTVMDSSCNLTLLCGHYPPGTYRMRVMLSERRNNEGAPCDSGDYGQVYDFYYNAYCTTAPILGDSVLCSNDTAILIPPGRCGFWSSSDYAVAYVDDESILRSSVSTGAATITYKVFGCPSVTKTVSVVPTPFSTTRPLCVGGSLDFTSWPAGGTWSSSAGVSLTPFGATCNVAGVTAGSAYLYYFFGGCTASFTIPVLSSASITGDSVICSGTIDTVYSAIASVAGGSWFSTNSSIIALLGNGAVVSGYVPPDTFTVRYMSPGGGCTAYKHMVVVAPEITGGPTSMCAGGTGTMSGSAGGFGAWSVTSPVAGLMNIDPVTGAITTDASKSGVATVSYTINGCIATRVLTVLPTPAILTMNVCQGAVIDLSLPYTPASYGSSNAYMVSVSSAGIATALMCCGMVTITRSYPATGCWSQVVVNVNLNPSILGSTTVPCGNSVTLTAYPVGGTWSSSNTSVATISSSGVVSNGSVFGTSTITYNSGLCVGTTTITTIPPGISGGNFICHGSTISLTPDFTGGAWSSTNPSVATISGGTVYGVTNGTATISYSSGSCSVSKNVTVRFSPGLVLGVGSNPGVCVSGSGSPMVLDASMSGGVWTSSYNLSLGVVGPDSRSVTTSVGPGSGWVTYTVTHAEGVCTTTRAVSLTGPPAVSGPPKVCMSNGGDNPDVILTATGPPPISWSIPWPSSMVATISSSGVLTGLNAGTVFVTCTDGNGCSSIMPVKVLGIPLIRQCCGCSGSTMSVGGLASVFGKPKDGGHFEASNLAILEPAGYDWTSPEFCMSPIIFAKETNFRGVSPGTAKAFYVNDGTGCRMSVTFTVH